MSSDKGSEYVVRRPEVGDAEELGALHVAVWREAYVGMMSQDVLDRMDAGRYAERWRTIIESSQTVAAESQFIRIAQHVATGELAGFAWAGPARDDDPPAARQLWAINVLAAHHGSGVADLLMAATIADDDAYLWVVEQNARAQSFYRRHGFEPDGGRVRDEDLAADEIRLLRRQV